MEFTEVLKIFLTAMLPVVELRGALPLAIAKGMQPVAALALCTAGNLLPVPFIMDVYKRQLLSQGHQRDRRVPHLRGRDCRQRAARPGM